MKRIIMAILGSAILASCGSVASTMAKSEVGAAQASVEKTQWKLADHTKGKTPTLVIENGRVSGDAGCNTYFANLLIDKSVGDFKVANVASTKMACNNANEEKNFLTMLQSANKYVTYGETLELYKDNLLLMKFSKLK